ncbi:MalY/PatB family protein [Corynebacterium caspium]|uniref:MalY/PatB family protein n=1 Tax=Corynebacterium caspium TaxID=234828 RepID=UPI00036CC8EF|nr:aminotransferase class I/II-fold pyridoxal phosphate-dependent enzyme [Corynebacterium caspium]WKD58880.1 Cystathionine beta-lyase PatB [Corynebacterium caspium DSM 44850]
MKFPDLIELRQRKTMKWTTYPDDVLPLWIAESDFPTAPAIKTALYKAIDDESFGYHPAHSELPEAVADFYAAHYGWHPNPERIVPIPDVVRGMVLAVQYFTRPDSPIIVPVPSYPPFLQIPKTLNRKTIYVNATGGLDLTEIEQAFANGAGSLLLASPNNPLGYTFSEEFLTALVAVADRYGGRILVDEIHAPLVFSGCNIPAAGISEQAAKVCITITATSKAWNIAGLKCAQMIFTNEQDWEIWQSLTEITKEGTSILGIIGATACYQKGWEHLQEQLSYLKETRDYLVEELPTQIPGLKISNPDATYLLWLDFRDTAIGKNPAQYLLEHAKVALNDGSAFGPGGAGHARLNFATSREILAEAISRMAQAIKQAGSAAPEL